MVLLACRRYVCWMRPIDSVVYSSAIFFLLRLTTSQRSFRSCGAVHDAAAGGVTSCAAIIVGPCAFLCVGGYERHSALWLRYTEKRPTCHVAHDRVERAVEQGDKKDHFDRWSVATAVVWRSLIRHTERQTRTALPYVDSNAQPFATPHATHETRRLCDSGPCCSTWPL